MLPVNIGNYIIPCDLEVENSRLCLVALKNCRLVSPHVISIMSSQSKRIPLVLRLNSAYGREP